MSEDRERTVEPSPQPPAEAPPASDGSVQLTERFEKGADVFVSAPAEPVEVPGTLTAPAAFAPAPDAPAADTGQGAPSDSAE